VDNSILAIFSGNNRNNNDTNELSILYDCIVIILKLIGYSDYRVEIHWIS